MAIVHEGTTTKAAGASTSGTFTLPATATTGRLIVFSVKLLTSSSPTFTWPTGFTQWATKTNSNTFSGIGGIAYKIAQAGDASAAITFSWSGGITAEYGVICSIYSGIDTTTPLIAFNALYATTGSMANTTRTLADVTMTQANSYYYGIYSGGTAETYTPQVSMAERADFTLTASSPWGAADEAIAASGATGSRTVTGTASSSQWWSLATGINPASATTTLTQSTFRGRNDDGSETTATWKATAGTDWTQAVDTNFRVRFNISDSVAAATQNTAFVLRYSLNGGAYTAVSGASSVVRAFASANITDGVATTEQLAGAGTFNAGTIDEVDGSALGFTAATSTGQDTEVEYVVQIRSADVVNNDVINLRVYNGTTALNAYTDTPIITVSETAAAASLIWDSSIRTSSLLRR